MTENLQEVRKNILGNNFSELLLLQYLLNLNFISETRDCSQLK